MTAIIIATTFAFMVFTAYLGYTSSMHKLIKLLALPLFLALSGLVGWNYHDNLGAPIAREIPEKFDYVAHKVTGDEYIHVYIYTKERGDRLYIIPYTRDAARELAKAKEMAEQGMPVEGTNKPKGKTGEANDFKVRIKNNEEILVETK